MNSHVSTCTLHTATQVAQKHQVPRALGSLDSPEDWNSSLQRSRHYGALQTRARGSGPVARLHLNLPIYLLRVRGHGLAGEVQEGRTQDGGREA